MQHLTSDVLHYCLNLHWISVVFVMDEVAGKGGKGKRVRKKRGGERKRVKEGLNFEREWRGNKLKKTTVGKEDM